MNRRTDNPFSLLFLRLVQIKDLEYYWMIPKNLALLVSGVVL